MFLKSLCPWWNFQVNNVTRGAFEILLPSMCCYFGSKKLIKIQNETKQNKKLCYMKEAENKIVYSVFHHIYDITIFKLQFN